MIWYDIILYYLQYIYIVLYIPLDPYTTWLDTHIHEQPMQTGIFFQPTTAINPRQVGVLHGAATEGTETFPGDRRFAALGGGRSADGDWRAEGGGSAGFFHVFFF